MELTTIIQLWFDANKEILLSVFALGISVLTTRIYSQSFIVFSVLMLILFGVFAEQIFIALAVAGAVISFILKMLGL